MKRSYVVTDQEGNISWSDKKEKVEKFRSFEAARARAEEMASYNPGETIEIYERTAYSIVPVKAVETFRAHPIEHYK